VSRRASLGLLVVAVALLWGRALWPGFWLDETVTVWVVRDGLGEAAARAWRYQGQSPLYFVVAWAARRFLGTSELALRLPSVVALGLAAFGLARLGERLVDAETGRLAALVLACLAYHDAADARPYALATAAVVGAALAAVRWGERPTWARAAVLGAASALVAWAHPVFALALPGVAWLALARRREGKGGGSASVVLAGAVAVALGLPLVPQLESLAARRAALSFASAPTALELAADLVRPRALVALAVGLALAAVPFRGRARPHFERPPGERRFVGPLLAWHALPPVVLFLIARTSDAHVYVTRYLAGGLPALALLVAWLTRAIAPGRARGLVAAVFVALSVARFQEREDWRAAIAAANAARPDARTLVLVRPGLVESDDPAFGADAERQEYLRAPLAAYPLETGGAALGLVPHALVRENETEVEALLAEAGRRSRVILVSRSSASITGWLDHRLGVAGLVSASVAGGGEKIVVTVYERRR